MKMMSQPSLSAFLKSWVFCNRRALMNQDIYVVIEHLRSKVADISYVMVAAGRNLSRGTGGNVVAVLLGRNALGLANNLAADRVLYIDHPALLDFNPDAY